MQPADQTRHKQRVQPLRQIFGKQDMDSAELIATVSDALRSPLTAIKGYTETLLRHEQQLSELERQEFLQTINAASDELAETIDDLLDEAPVQKQTDAGGLRKNHRQATEANHQQPVQEHQWTFEEFHQRLHQQAAAFGVFHQVFADKLRILQEQQRIVRTIPDATQRQQAFQELQAEYLQLLQDLREQQVIYHQLRLDYEAQYMQLDAEKTVRQQRQEARRWQGDGDFF